MLSHFQMKFPPFEHVFSLRLKYFLCSWRSHSQYQFLRFHYLHCCFQVQRKNCHRKFRLSNVVSESMEQIRMKCNKSLKNRNMNGKNSLSIEVC